MPQQQLTIVPVTLLPDSKNSLTISLIGTIKMNEFTWRVFKETGNVDSYLLLKALEKEKHIINILPLVYTFILLNPVNFLRHSHISICDLTEKSNLIEVLLSKFLQKMGL